MSEKIDILVDSSIDVDAESQSVSASSDNDVEIEILEPDYQVSINKREYVITGDNLYIPKSYEESPQWLRDIIGTITDFTLNQKLTEIGALSNTLYGLIDELEVAKNTYTQSIISSADIDERINTAITTLNSSIAESDATIVDLITTKATPNEATSLALNVLTASINDGEISSIVGNIQNAISTTNSTLSNNIDILHSEMTGEFEGTADAIGGLRTYVGVSNDGGTTGTGLLADVEILQKQNDGIIETTTGTYDVMVNPQDPNLAQLVVAAEPYATWKAADVTGISNRLAHIGDVYVKYADTANGAKEYVASYKFIRTVVDETSPYATDSDGFTWALIVDQAAQDAYEQALNAYDLADNKRRVFTATPSGPYDEGDLWVRVASGSNQIWKCHATIEQVGYYNAADWSIASTDDTATVALQTGLADGTATVKLTNAYVGTTPFLTYLTNEIDSKVGVYSGETAPVAGQPSGVAANDIYLWFTTASKVLANGTTQIYDITRTYKYSGSAWAEITTDSNITALADLADGKRTVFSGNTVPVGAVARDIWIPSATNGAYLQGEIYQYNGIAWIVATKYTEDLDTFVDVTYTPTVTSLQNQVDSKIENWYAASTSDPKTAWTDVETRNKHNGDLWYQTDTKNSYYYSSSTHSWNILEDSKAIEALSAAATAQATADGVVVSYYAIKQDDAPATANLWLNKTGTKILKKYDTSWINVSVKVGDTLTAYDPDTKDISIYVYNGSSWITNTENGIVATSEWGIDLNAYLDNKAVGGTSSLISDITATSNNNLSKAVNSRFAYNSNLVVDGVTYPSGFGLSNSAGTGIGSEFWINADKFKFTNNGKTGSKAPFTIDASGPTPEITFNGKVSFNSIPRSSTNIIAETWSEGNGSTPLYNIVGSSDENVRIYMNNPSGQLSVVWVCIADGTGNSDGGWDTVPFQIDRTKTYRFSVFIKTNQANGSSYLGCGSNTVTTLNSSTKDGNPYFWYGDLPSQNEWYLLVGYVYPSGKTGLVSNGGIYSCTNGRKVANTTDFNWAADAVNSSHKCYLYYSDSQFTRQFMYDPRVEMVDGNEPSILDMINTTNVGYSPSEVVSSINGGQTTTIDGEKITTGSIVASQINVSDAFVGHTLQSTDYNGIDGFILKSNAAGTSVDPTIYGAYIKGSTLEGSSIKLREITVLTDSNHETKAIIGASSILSGSIWTYDIYPYNSTSSTRNRLAKSSNNTVVFAGNTVNSNVSSYVSYRGWVSLAVSTGGVQSGSYPYIYNNVLTVTIDGTSHTFSADTQISPYTFPCGLTLVTVFTITNVNTGSGYTCLFIKPYCDSFTLTSGANLTIGVSNLAGSLIMDSRYGNEVIVYNI